MDEGVDPYWPVEGQGVHWPKVALGNGLKPYDAEVEPFIPPSAEEPLSLPFSSVFMHHQQNLQRESDTPPENSPVHIQVEDSALSSPPSTAVSTNQIPIFLPLPRSPRDAETNAFYGGDTAGLSEIVLPPPYSVLSMLPPQSTDLMYQQQTLPATQEAVLQPMSNTPCLSGRSHLTYVCKIFVLFSFGHISSHCVGPNRWIGGHSVGSGISADESVPSFLHGKYSAAICSAVESECSPSYITT